MPEIAIQNAEEPPSTMPTNDVIKSWANHTLQAHQHTNAELTIRFVSHAEMQDLNNSFRGINKPTNVLSFQNDTPPELQALVGECPYLGDIIICPDIVHSEAINQTKTFEHHLAHMVVHGCLHLLGYDHEIDEDATTMESFEIQHLAQFNIPNPYQTKHQHEAPLP